MRSAAALALSRIGIDCTRPKQAPTMNNSAVVVLAIDEPPSVSLKFGATNTTAPSRMYIEICDVTIILKVSAWVRILMLAAVFDTSRASSNRSSLRAVLSLTSLKPSRKSTSRSNSRRSHAADSPFCAAKPLVLVVENQAGAGDDDDGQGEGGQRQIGDVESDEKDQHRALHGKAQHIACLGEHRGIAGDRGDDARAADPLQFQKLRTPDHVHQPHADLVDDGLDLGSGGDGDELLRFDEQKQRDQEKRGGPQPGLLAVAGLLHAGIDGGENGRIADAADAGHEHQLRHRAVHFAANELDEGH